MENLGQNVEMSEKMLEKNEKKVGGGKKLGLKMLIIAVLGLLMLIPQQLLLSLVRERQSMSESAKSDVYSMWGGEQLIIGPVIRIPGVNEKVKDLYVLPEDFKVNGNVKTEDRKRGIFDVTIFNSDLSVNGYFSELTKYAGHSKLDLSHAEVLLAVKDLKGLGKNVKIKLNGEEFIMKSGHDSQLGNVLVCKLTQNQLVGSDKMEYSLEMNLKGSESLKFLPVGNTTEVKLTSDCKTPSFSGNFLPGEREVREDGFTACWNVLSVNRNFAQEVYEFSNYESGSETYVSIRDNEFGVDLRVPVMQYQQTERTVKYAILFIFLTFATVFFVEYHEKTKIHPVQYLLIGMALLIFYSLLLSLSEHLPFLWSYIISMVMVVVMICGFLWSLVKAKKTAVLVGMFLIVLYVFIYILLQLETFALLAGTIGLFILLGVAMYFSRKINWYGE